MRLLCLLGLHRPYCLITSMVWNQDHFHINGMETRCSRCNKELP